MIEISVEDRLRQARYTKDERGIYRSGNEGYWSNLDKEENQKLLDLLERTTPLEAIRATHPKFEPMIFSEKREAALELLDIRPGEVCLDYGCMWGVLSVGMAKRGGVTVAVDQTYPSLAFLSHRRRHDKLDNLFLVQDDIKKVDLPELADCALVHGVLEWIPETGEVDLKRFYGKRQSRPASATATASPDALQLDFLRRVCRNLKPEGRLLLAIENRYDYTQFIGKRDPHSDLWLTSILPRPLADRLSKVQLGRPYVNYIYSFPELKKLILRAGFSQVDLYMCFPHYHFPEMILPYEGGIKKYWPRGMDGCSWRKKAAALVERFLMKRLKARFFAPSIIAVAAK